MKPILAAAFLALSLSLPVPAETLSSPTGDVILTISGATKHETSDGVVQLDLDLLKALPQTQFTTTTIWVDGKTEFTGVSLKTLLNHVGYTGSKIEAIALNDYKIEIPNAGIEDDAPIVAYLMNGAQMSARSKGPLWIVYPYDTGADYRTEVIYSRSIWQLDRIIAIE